MAQTERADAAAANGEVAIEVVTGDAVVDLALDTLRLGKQTLVFCSTKRGAEAQADRIAARLRRMQSGREEWAANAHTVVSVLSSPTKQCRRLAACLEQGVAFHHAGLHRRQRSCIEDGFRAGSVSIICCTPTLAMGLDLPAFRVVIRDVKRFGGRGMQDIPVLEYEQMAGRAGRPGKESFGEAVLVASSPAQAALLTDQYIRGVPEPIFSKLAVEPVLRTYVLSLVAAGFLQTRQDLYAFFEETFYASQYGDTQRLRSILDAMLEQLAEWGFLTPQERGDFVPANALTREASVSATPLGRRVAELYLDPLTAQLLLDALGRASPQTGVFAWLHCFASCLELRPLLRPRAREIEELAALPAQHELLLPEPAVWSAEYDGFLAALKTALFFRSWIDEVQEEQLLERFGIGPGEVHVKLERVDWLLYAAEELARMQRLHALRSPLRKLRLRLKYGAREELLPLLQLKGVGRVRARRLYGAGIRSLAEVKKAPLSRLAELLGNKVAQEVKVQLGEPAAPDGEPDRERGQRRMLDF